MPQPKAHPQRGPKRFTWAYGVSMTINTKIIERIQKLLNLSESSNGNESRLAAQMAGDLLLRHNLSMQQINGHDSEVDTREVYDSRFVKVEDKFVCIILKKFFFVHPYTSKKSDRSQCCWANHVDEHPQNRRDGYQR